jgi:hypothetical protein
MDDVRLPLIGGAFATLSSFRESGVEMTDAEIAGLTNTDPTLAPVGSCRNRSSEIQSESNFLRITG